MASPDETAAAREALRRVTEAVQDDIAGRGPVARATREDYLSAARDAMRRLSEEGVPGMPADEWSADALARDVYDAVGPGRLGPIEPLLAADAVTEIMVNGPDEVWAEVGGVIRRARVSYADDDAVRACISRIVVADGKLCDEAHPMCDCVLHRPGEACDQSRVNCVVPPIAVDHPLIDIRKFRKDVSSLDALVGYGTIDEMLAEYLRRLVAARMNVIITGGTGTGKTTLLNAMARCIPDTERIVTIEDTPELSIDKPQVVRMASRDANAEGRGEVTIRRLVKNALRQRPDRIIIGECRGEEAMEMLQAMSTGHDGSLSTVHANDPRDALSRLNVMVHYGSELSEDIVKQVIASAVDYIVALHRFPDGSRKVVEVTEVQGYAAGGDGGHGVITTAPIWRYHDDGQAGDGRQLGHFEPTGQVPGARARAKFDIAHVDVDPTWFGRGL